MEAVLGTFCGPVVQTEGVTEELEAFVLQRFVSGDGRPILCPQRRRGSALGITHSHGLALLPPALVHESSPPSENSRKV